MRVLAERRLALALVLALLSAACGVLIDVADDPAEVPERADGSQDEGAVTQQEGGEPDAAAGDASAATDACATAAVCSPERLATLGGGALRLVVSGSSLYAARMAGSGPHVVSLASGAPGPVLELDPQANAPDIFRGDSNLAVDSSGAVYWGTPNGLRRREPGAGADASTGAGVTNLSALGAPVSGVRIADGRLHFTVNGPQGVPAPNVGHIASCALPGCGDVQTAVLTPYPLDVIAVGASRWWLGTDNLGANMALRKPGLVITGEQLSPGRMATDGQHIYWSTVDGLRMYTIATDALADLSAGRDHDRHAHQRRGRRPRGHGVRDAAIERAPLHARGRKVLVLDRRNDGRQRDRRRRRRDPCVLGHDRRLGVATAEAVNPRA